MHVKARRNMALKLLAAKLLPSDKAHKDAAIICQYDGFDTIACAACPVVFCAVSAL